MKYYIKRTAKQFGTVEYKRYKCIDGFSKKKELCWQFSKQGAEKIIERLKDEYRRNINNVEFELEEVIEEAQSLLLYGGMNDGLEQGN